ncbi:hypothetical protein CMV_001937 [Castanea mollissima]|uniref:Uncharacterized protein n=1 Tax=Castanea mollissima TaxID=60419 RepID=A0A8J4VWJ7_9ROSI|nr:hypothetical protein CMV_001937 [Castanea mollissima]
MLVNFSSQTNLGGGDVGSRSNNEEFEFGETNTVGNYKRSLLNFNSNRNKHAYGKERESMKADWTGGGLIVEVNGEGIRRVVWKSNKGGLKNSIWVNRNQREHVVGPSSGSRAYQNSRVIKGGLRSSKWVPRSQRGLSRAQNQGCSVLGLDQEFNSQLGFPEPTGPFRMVVGASPALGDQRLLYHNAQALERTSEPHKALDTKATMSDHTDAGGALAEESPAPLEELGLDQEFNSQLGFPEPTGPFRMVVGASPALGDQRLLYHNAQALERTSEPHKALDTKATTSDHTDAGGALAEESPAPLEEVGTV